MIESCCTHLHLTVIGRRKSPSLCFFTPLSTRKKWRSLEQSELSGSSGSFRKVDQTQLRGIVMYSCSWVLEGHGRVSTLTLWACLGLTTLKILALMLRNHQQPSWLWQRDSCRSQEKKEKPKLLTHKIFILLLAVQCEPGGLQSEKLSRVYLE